MTAPYGCVPRGAARLRGAQLQVYVALASHWSEVGGAFPSQATLAVETGLDPKTVRDALAALEDAGWVTRRARRRARVVVWDITEPGPTRPETAPVTGPPGPGISGPPGPGEQTPRTDPTPFPSGTAAPPSPEEPTMTRAATPDPDQMGLDLGVPEPGPKPRKVNGPQTVLEAYEAAYRAEHQQPSLRPVGRTRAEAKRLLDADEPLERVVEAAEALARGGNVFHTLDEECRRLRAHAERAERARTAVVSENYGGSDASVPSTWIYG